MELKEGYKQTEVGVIPEEWEPTLLDSIAKRGSGHTPSKSFPEYWNGEVKWISLQDSHRLDNGVLFDTEVSISEKGLANSSAKLHPSGTVVLSRDAGVGKSAIMGCDMAVSQHFMAWIAGNELDNFYLYYWLQITKPEFERIAIGNTIKTIGLPYFKALKVPLPPTKAEQEAIAEALSDADALIESLEQLIAKKRQIKQGAMQELLTGKRHLPGFSGAWAQAFLGDVAEFFKGRGLPKSAISPSGADICIHYGELFTHYDHTIKEILSRTDAAADAFRSLANDVLMPTSDVTPKGLAKASCVLQDGIVLGGDILVIRTEMGRVNGSFLACLIRFEQERVLRLVTGSTVYHLYASDMKNFELRLPELDEQAAITTIISDMDAEIDALETKLSKAKQVKQGMMQELLTGHIRLTQWEKADVSAAEI